MSCATSSRSAVASTVTTSVHATSTMRAPSGAANNSRSDSTPRSWPRASTVYTVPMASRRPPRAIARTAASASSTVCDSGTETNSVVMRPPAVDESYWRSRSVSARSFAGIASRISSATSSSISSSASARSSGVIRASSGPACSGSIASRTSVRTSSCRYSSTFAAREVGSDVRKRGSNSRGNSSATSARSAGCISSVSAAIDVASLSSRSRMSGATRAATDCSFFRGSDVTGCLPG